MALGPPRCMVMMRRSPDERLRKVADCLSRFQTGHNADTEWKAQPRGYVQPLIFIRDCSGP